MPENPPQPERPFKVIVDASFKATIEFTLNASSEDEAAKLAKRLTQKWCKVSERFPWEVDEPRPEFDASVDWNCDNAEARDVYPAKKPAALFEMACDVSYGNR